MPDKRPLENGSALLGEVPKRAKLVDAKGSAALVRQKLLALQNKIQSNPKLKALRSANQARIKQALESGKPGGAVDGQRAPLPSQGSIYSAARSTASALEAAARATNPSIASRFSSGQILPGVPTSDSRLGSGPAGKPESVKFFDPYIGKKSGRRERYRKSFWFVDEGRYEKEAELERIRAKYGDEVAIRIQLGRLAGLRGVKKEDIQRYLDSGKKVETTNDAIEDVEDGKDQDDEMHDEEESDASDPPEDIPNVEWWDQVLLVSGSYDVVTDEGPSIKPNKITIYIQHPVPIEPPSEALPPPPQPLKLTKKEMKKLRSQRRQQREKEKQELIRQGLLEPPKPKVKISNMMRVLAEEAAADPTAIEKEVRKAMEERQQAHEDRNLARKLTPAERKDKKLKKLFDDDEVEEQACLFKVLDLSNPKNKYKVTINAEENRLTGRCIIADGYAVVVVEGCQKSIRRYKRLMLKRIKWDDSVEADDEDAEANGGIMEPRVVNACHLVWEGSVKKPFFTDFQSQEIIGEHSLQRYFDRFNVGHYLDLVKGFDPEVALEENLGGTL